jgi:hypothetical protein
MAFASAVVERRMLPGGLMLERGTWSGAAGAVSTGDITCATSGGGDANPDIQDIIMWSFGNDMDNAVLPAKDVAPNKIKITFTASDTGTYNIIGRCA